MATLKDIADRAGVSVGTVDRILHKRGRYSDRTAQKVRRILRELEYQPNLMARQLSQSRTCRIAVILPSPEQDSAYWSLPLEGIRRAERDLSPFGLNLDVHHYNRYEPPSFTAAGKKVLEADYDGILMAPLLTNEARNLLGAKPPRGKVIFFDTDIPDARRLSYIGQDSYQSGRLGARLVNILAGGSEEGNTHNLIISPNLENEHLDNRIRGFSDYSLLDSQILRITIESDHNLASLQELLSRQLSSETAGIFVVDASSHFVADFIQARIGTVFRKKPALVGYDLVPENRRRLENGMIDFLLTQRPEEQGYNGVNRLFRMILLDENCPGNEYTPIDIVTRENLRYINEENE